MCPGRFSDSPLNMDIQIIQTLRSVPLVSVLTGFHCICQACSVKMAGHWPRLFLYFFACLWTTSHHLDLNNGIRRSCQTMELRWNHRLLWLERPILELQSAYGALSFRQFAIQDILWDSDLLHSTNMPQPWQASPHAWKITHMYS